MTNKKLYVEKWCYLHSAAAVHQCANVTATTPFSVVGAAIYISSLSA
jgi:hypothetical protein